MVPEIWSSTDRIVLSSWAIFHSFTPLKTRKMTISKMKKTLNKMEVSSFYTSVPKTIIIRHVPEIRHVMDVIAIFILGYTFPFYFPNSPKTWKFQNNEKKRLQISSFYTNVPKNHHMLYCSWDMVFDGCNCCFSFWAIFCPFSP